MGAAVARNVARSTRERAPRLRLVGQSKPRTGASPSKRARSSAARDLFTAFASLVIVLSLLGLGRVWLSVQAAEASIRSNELRHTIKSERYEGDMLEVRQSALGSPSRIRAIASGAMDMKPSRKVTIVTVGPAARGAAPVQSAAGTRGGLSSIMDLMSGEAQVLLVGSIGLAR